MPGQALPVVGESGRTLEYPSPLLEGYDDNMTEEQYGMNSESSRRMADVEGTMI